MAVPNRQIQRRGGLTRSGSRRRGCRRRRGPRGRGRGRGNAAPNPRTRRRPRGSPRRTGRLGGDPEKRAGVSWETRSAEVAVAPTQEEGRVGLVDGVGRGVGPVHLPFRPHFIEPVTLDGPQQVGVGDHYGPQKHGRASDLVEPLALP